MSAEEALQAHIAARIPKELQRQYAREVELIRDGWRAAMKFMKTKSEDPKP